MEKSAIRKAILETISNLDLKSFDFEDIKRLMEPFIITENNAEKPIDVHPVCEALVHEAMRDLVKERIISVIPHGCPIFFLNKQQ